MTDTQFAVLVVVIAIYGLCNILVTASWGREIKKILNERY